MTHASRRVSAARLRAGRLLARAKAALGVPTGLDGPVAAAPPIPLGDLVRRFWPYARPYRRWIAVSLLLVAAVAGLETLAIYLFKLVVDHVLVPGDLGALPPIAAVYAGMALVGGVLDFADRYVSTLATERFVLDVRDDVFARVLGGPLHVLEDRPLGDTVTRLTGDVGAVEGLVLSGLTDAVAYGLRIVFFVVAIFVLRWELALVSIVAAPLFFLAARRFSRLVKDASRERRRRSGSIAAVAQEALGNLPLVQAYGREDHERERFAREGRGALEAQLASARIKGLFTPIVDTIELVGVLAVVAFGAWEIGQGRLTLGTLLAFITYLGGLYSPLRGLSKLSNAYYSASAGAERIIELLDGPPGAADPPRPYRPDRVRGEIAFEAVSFRYPGAEADALTDVSFRVEPGRVVALVGASGAGKSSLVKLLLRFGDPTSGRVTLDGVDVREWAVGDLRAQLAVLFQETLVLDGTVRENVAYGRPGASEAELHAAADRAGATEFINRLPGGWHEPVGGRGRRLSGGQAQRLAIARALLRDSPVVVLDEPTTGLDAGAADRVLEPMRRLMAERTTIVVSHDLLTVRDADEILVLDGGRLVERGDHPALLARGGRYAELWRRRHPAPPLRSVA